MQNITRDAIEHLLAGGQAQPMVTIYAPMHVSSSPPHISENQIRLKNLLTKAIDEIVKTYGEDTTLASELSEELGSKYDDAEFWERQTPGLLICARPGAIHLLHLPVDTDEYVAVDDQFHLAPVLAMAGEDQPYYVLMVNQHNPKLFIGDIYGLHISDIKLPSSVQEALNIDEPNQKSENQGSAGGTSMKAGWFNGRGGGRNPQEEDRMKFFRIIDKLICDQDRRGLPMVLAGIEAETVEFRAVSKYPKILTATVNGSHADFDMKDLHSKSWRIIDKELVMPMRQAALDEYQRLEGANPNRIARETSAIESATEQGRVDKLLAAMDKRTTDTIRDSIKTVSKISFPDRAHSALLNHVASKVWSMSGTIINITPQAMPHGAAMVARLRY